MSSLTIAHVSTQRGWHGGEEQARLLCEGLRRHGHKNLIFAREDGQFGQRMRELGFEVHDVQGNCRTLRAIWSMRQAWRGLRPNVVHFHDPHALSGGGLAALGLGIPARIAARRANYPIHFAWRYRFLVDRVIAVSRTVGDVCRASGIAEGKIRIVCDGVDPRRAQSGDRQRGRAALGIQDETLLLTVATLTDAKGHTYLLQALPRVLRQHPNVLLALAGDGELRQQLAQEAQQLGVADRVRFLGYREDVPDLLKGADLFVLPSHMEGLCSTLIDVMFAQTPIVATTAGGIPELVGTVDDDPPVGWQVPPRDPEALADAILQALASQAASREFVQRAEARANLLFTDERMVEGTLRVYRELVPQ